jgi:hypothetical protein
MTPIDRRVLAHEWLWFAGTFVFFVVPGFVSDSVRGKLGKYDFDVEFLLYLQFFSYGAVSFVRLTIWAIRTIRAAKQSSP